MVAQGIQQRQALVIVIGHRAPIDTQPHFIANRLECAVQKIIGHLLQFPGLLGVDMELSHHCQSNFPEGSRLFILGRQNAAHNDGLVEEPRRRRGLQQGLHLAATAGLSENGHVAGVSAESGNIVMHPLQRGHQVRNACIAGIGVLLSEGGHIKIAQDIQPVIDCDNHYIAVGCQCIALVGDLFNRGAVGVAAAMEPDHNRALAVIQPRCPDIQELAVFIRRPEAVGNKQLAGRGRASGRGADVAIICGVAHTLPGLYGMWRLEAICIGIGNSVEGINAVQQEAPKGSGFGLDQGGILRA